MNEMESERPADRARIIIAGGKGFIGRRLAAVLGGAGYEVIILTRSNPGPPIGPIRFVQWSGIEALPTDSWPTLLEGAHAVVNLCGESIGGPRWTAARKRRLLESRVAPTEALVQAINACQRPPSLLVQASGVGYYGPGMKPVDESAGKGSDFLAELAGHWESPLLELRDDVRQITARLGVVLGKTGGALGQMLMPFRLFVGGPIASGNQWLSWIHLHDAAGALATLIGDPTSRGNYNVTAPNPVRNVEFAELAGRSLGRPGWLFTPRVVLKILLGEQATLVCDGQQAPPERLLKVPYTFTYPTLDSAFETLI